MIDLASLRDQVEAEIRARIMPQTYPLTGLDTMNGYHLGFCDREGNPAAGSKGKYLRPLFCLAVCAGLGGDIQKALPAAASLELIHRTTLVFDDMQDKGEQRNGRPAMWTIWGTNQAINAGLALSCHARLTAQGCYNSGLSAQITLRILNVLENAVMDLCWGQYYDLSFQERYDIKTEDYMRMIEGKTGTLFGAACEVGALCASLEPLSFYQEERIEKARDFGLVLGKAFQIWDDYLGIWGNESIVGKTANDLVEKKRSFPIVRAMEVLPELASSYLRREDVTPEDAHTFRLIMEQHGIKEETKLQAHNLILESRKLLEQLNLSQYWEDQIGQFLNMVINRVI